MIDLGDELAEEYLAECSEHLKHIETDLLAIEKGGAADDEQQMISRVFQAVHAVGGAGVFGLVAIRDLAHEMENVLTPVRAHQMPVTSDRIGVLLRATDKLHEMIQDPLASNQTDAAEIMAALSRIEETTRSRAEHRDFAALGPNLQNECPFRVLLVEDDFASRLLLQTFLSRYGECHIAVNGREAVDAFRSALDAGLRYDLICMDIMMPEMDGREAVRQVRALEEDRGIRLTQGAKIIMTTAVREFKEVIRCFEDLCDAYLMKPINLAKLLRQMRSWQLIPPVG